ncbi:hypothetical protein LDENG_00239920, partial [Lucifuga dentata]
LIQNFAARLLTKTKKQEHITAVLVELHQLPLYFRINSKILLLSYKALNCLEPNYIADIPSLYVPPCTLRSSSTKLLDNYRSSERKFGDAAFAICAPKLWNGLPQNIREANSTATFKRLLKIYFSQSSYFFSVTFSWNFFYLSLSLSLLSFLFLSLSLSVCLFLFCIRAILFCSLYLHGFIFA